MPLLFHELELPVEVLDHARGLPLPRYMTADAAGMDLYAAVTEEITINPGRTGLIPTGLKLAVPRGFEAQIRPRSGLAAKKGIGILNSPGTVDSDYRGEIMVILINLGEHPFTVGRGERIAQMVICPVLRAMLVKVRKLPPTKRGEGGFGHTGID